MEESIRLYEDGMKLVGQCHQTLADAEQRIKILQTTNATVPMVQDSPPRFQG